MSKIEVEKRRAAFMKLDDAWHKEMDFIEVTEWSNKEGWDITINERLFQLHFTEYQALKKLIKFLEKN